MTEGQRLDFKEFKPINGDLQEKLSQDICCLLAMQALKSNRVQLTFENIVLACFQLFPAKFSLPHHPEYPDSYAVHNSVNLHMQYSKGSERHWVQGNKRQGYSITPQGTVSLERYLWVLGEKSYSKSSKRLDQGETRFLQLIVSSEAYKKFEEGMKEQISEEEVCFMLRFPVGDDPRHAANQLAKAEKIAEAAGNKKVEGFLKEIAASHRRLFSWKGDTWHRRIGN